MTLIQVDVIGLQSLERRIDLLVHLCRGEAAIRLGHREVELGRKYVRRPLLSVESITEKRFGCSLAIDIGSIDEVDPELECPVDTGSGNFVVDSEAIGEPRSERDLGNPEVTISQLSVFHLPGLRIFPLGINRREH